MMLLTSRPEADLRWAGHPRVTLRTLNQLSRQQSGALVEQVTNGKVLPPEMLDPILVKTDGLPANAIRRSRSTLCSER
jgi:hypothetical protein